MDSSVNPNPNELSEPIVSDLVPAAAWSSKPPLNGVVEESGNSPGVMDSGLWPPLGDSTKPALKSSSSESLPEVIPLIFTNYLLIILLIMSL